MSSSEAAETSASETPELQLPDPQDMEAASALAQGAVAELDRQLLGRHGFHRLVLVGILSRGHILLEGVPGVGKTALIKALGEILGLGFKRVQFTPDLMPGDILGGHLLEEGEDGRRSMRFQEGPIFTQILLADEINRASPKTQSALLEAMQESSVTLLGTTRQLPEPFFVLASQNPIELEGTYPLPEAQLDRFLFKLNVEPPGVDVLEGIVRTRRRGKPPKPRRALTDADLQGLFDLMGRIALPRAVARYIARLVAATHPRPGADGESPGSLRYIRFGASPRAAIALGEASRAQALLAGRPTVGFEDVEAVAEAVLRHRLILDYQARFDGVTVESVIAEAMASLDVTELGLDDGIDVVAVPAR